MGVEQPDSVGVGSGCSKGVVLKVGFAVGVAITVDCECGAGVEHPDSVGVGSGCSEGVEMQGGSGAAVAVTVGHRPIWSRIQL